MAEATAKVERLQQEMESMKELGSNDVLETGDQPQKSLSGTQQFHDIEWPIGILGNHFFLRQTHVDGRLALANPVRMAPGEHVENWVPNGQTANWP